MTFTEATSHVDDTGTTTVALGTRDLGRRQDLQHGPMLHEVPEGKKWVREPLGTTGGWLGT
ncbi:hypothetical protein ACQEVF_11690 [Nonomuraea polychroma]|uniref:hypothetical protein n=1 Tax=Nonomuraea polychroma TaxID=46176 RepID=UPI003D8B8752